MLLIALEAFELDLEATKIKPLYGFDVHVHRNSACPVYRRLNSSLVILLVLSCFYLFCASLGSKCITISFHSSYPLLPSCQGPSTWSPRSFSLASRWFVNVITVPYAKSEHCATSESGAGRPPTRLWG